MQKRLLRLIPLRCASALCTGVLLCLPILVALSISPPSFASDEQLSGVKNEIARQQSQLAASSKKLDSLQSSLKNQEQAIGEIAKQIRQTRENISSLAQQIGRLDSELQKLEQQKLGQTELLKELLNSHYRQGSHSQLGTLLSGKDSSVLDRMTVYAETLSKTRTAAINELAATDTELRLKTRELADRRERQQSLLANIEQEKSKLEQQQSSRKKTARNIKKQINSDKSYLSELKTNEKRLTTELAQAAEKARIAAEQAKIAAEQAKVKMDGLARYKGKLSWPVKGKVVHKFGTEQQGELRWSGVVLDAKTGTEVKAAHDGTVVLSNWLRGYGLMVVVDHGHGDMSFYGYNQALLKNVGDTIKSGEPIALVGNSGGQESPGLYFEIRRKGSATNPLPWLRR